MSGRLLLDVNVLLALSWSGHVHHEQAHRKFAEVQSWSTTSITELGFLRLMLTEAVMGRAVHASEAFAQLQAFRSVDGWSWIPDDISPTTWATSQSSKLGRRQVTDLHLVNLAAANDSRLATFDVGVLQLLRPRERHLVEVWS